MTTPLSAALAYIRRGWCPIPVPYRDKGPTIKHWEELRISEAEAANYFNGAKQNIGVLLGPPSHNLTDVE
jgi:hypothetical protein